MFWWLKTVFAVAALLYLVTMLIGLLGNSWVIASLFRTSKKTALSAAGNSLNPSDRLRKYIWLLALLDLCVSGSLLFRVWGLLLPDQPISDSVCQWVFATDQLVKLCSLTCLACISIERFITIRKPFNNKLRKVAVQLTPLFAFFTVANCGAAIVWMARHSVGATEDGSNCSTKMGEDGGNGTAGNRIASWALAIGLCAQLVAIESNYLRIVLHVRRKFWQRKARAVASSEKSLRHFTAPLSASSSDPARAAGGTARLLKRASPPPPPFAAEVPVPRYMRDMTAAIVRIAVFHLICWLPYCLLQLLSLLLPYFLPLLASSMDSLRVHSVYATVRVVEAREHEWIGWLAFVANWLTYFNSAGNWVLYAALNRDLRSIIKACSERRKRSTMSQPPQTALGGSSPGGATIGSGVGYLRRSVRRTALHSLRLFYSLNSHRSSAASADAGESVDAQSAATHLASSSQLPNGSSASPRTSLRAPSFTDSIRRKTSAQSSVSSGGTDSKRPASELGTYGWRDGRAHTYCSPAAASREPLVNTAEQKCSAGRTSQSAAATCPQSPSPSTNAAHMKMAQQIIAAVYGGGKSIGMMQSCGESGRKQKKAAEMGEEAEKRRGGGGQRRESAQERRELFAQTQSPLPPILVVSMSAASVEEKNG